MVTFPVTDRIIKGFVIGSSKGLLIIAATQSDSMSDVKFI